MGDPVTINLRHVARGLGIPLGQVQAVLELLDEGNTVPFITRYRKDQTGGLDEEQIRQIQARLTKMRMLAERKQTILRSIESQGKLTEKLSKQIRAAGTAKRLEDLYLPFKPKKQTLATLARSRGLEPLANEILAAEPGCADLDARAADFVNPDRQVPTAADALLGAGHILAEQFSEQVELRQRLREILQRTGKLLSSRLGGEPTPPSEKADKPEAGSGQAPGEASSSDPDSDGGSARSSDASPAPAAGSGGAQQSLEAETPTEAKSGPQEGANSPPEPDQAEAADEGRRGEVMQSAEPAAESGEPLDEAPPESPADGHQNDAQSPSESDCPAEGETESAPGLETPLEPPAQGQPADQPPDDRLRASDSSGEGGPPADAESGVAQPGQAQAERAGADGETPGAPAPKVRSVQAKSEGRRTRKEQKKKKAEEKLRRAFSDYFDYSEEIKKIPPHRVLAINRGERAKVLRVKIEYDVGAMHRALDELCLPAGHPHCEFLRGCARDALARLILPGLEREIRRELTERAEAHAVGVFARNLRNLLLQPPVRGRRVLAVDPGYRSGCKLAALDQFGNMLAHGVIYLIGRPDRKQEARRIVTELIERFQLTAVTIGNGTACREAEEFFAGLIAEEFKEKGVAYVIVNEAGASVYSTSRLGREEFPDYDASLRGAISIGRRLQDPLSELVKIDPANIGVGLYQHDVKARHLRASLDEVVESCVNYVGVDVNTASPALLRYVSGLNQLTARRVYEHRLQNGPFRNREQLREVPGFGEATFVQAAGFLKITGGDNPLDATWIHPESYGIAEQVMATLECAPADLSRKDAAGSLAGRLSALDVAALSKDVGGGELLLRDILSQLARPGRDPREDLPAPVFKQGVLKLEDLSPGMELTGTVLNVVDFGAFVDIGMHDSGLVHVSQLADKFVRDPHDVISVGDIVKVWVVEVDKQRRRVSLTMISPAPRRSAPRREEKPAGRRPPDRAERPAGRESGGGESKPRRKGPPRSRAKGKPRPRYQPRQRARPVIPITEEMKAGTEPMRSFSDLAQFFETKDEGTRRGPPKSKPQPAKGRAPATKAEPENAKDQAEVPVVEDQGTADQGPVDHDKPCTAQGEEQAAPRDEESTKSAPQPSLDESPGKPDQPQDAGGEAPGPEAEATPADGQPESTDP